MMVTPLVGAECLLEIAIEDIGASVSVRLYRILRDAGGLA